MAEPQLAQVLYRSVATQPFSPEDLQELADAARRRNAHESLTGLLVYHDGRFVQWLEGPDDGVRRVWSSIRDDPRHRAIERLYAPSSAHRLFPDWRLQIGASNTDGIAEAVCLAVPTLQELHGQDKDARAILRGIAFWSRLPAPLAMATLLARGSDAEVRALGERVAAMAPSWPSIGMHLMGPVARALGDAWKDDRLDATDLAIAQARLLVLLHETGMARAAEFVAPHAGLALVAPLPGERELAGMTFAGLALEAAGWQVDRAFPATTSELSARVGQQPYEVLHLSLSDVFPKQHRMSELAATIRAARGAATDRCLQILVSGRAFVELPGLAVLIGADGEGFARGTDAQDLPSMRGWTRLRAKAPAMQAAQFALLQACAHIRHGRFGDPADAAHLRGPVH
ncbi:MAG TPA: BLUF domain-containing protein [Burkholderiaceae bacterium]|nr:BLUF domain-containing protein [Burkholderiaceae bacterium]